MTRLCFEDVEVRLRGAKTLLGPASFDLSPGTTLVLCGETGSGKSLALELMAGLRRPSSGTVCHDDREASRIPAARRGVGMLFQNGQLYEHLDVRRNIGFALRDRNDPAIEAAAETACCAEILAGHEGRVDTLSGGERRRVALAKALASDPAILLLDEPFAGLDPMTRYRLRRSLARLIADRQGTTVLALHDLDDALALGDRLILLHEGRIIADGSPKALLTEPPSCEAALRLRHPVPSRLKARIRDGRIELPGGTLTAPTGHADGWYDFILPAHGATIEAKGEGRFHGWKVWALEPVQEGTDLLLAHETMAAVDPVSCLRVRADSNQDITRGGTVEVRFEVEDGLLFPSAP